MCIRDSYCRNIIRPGKKTKEKVDVFSFELLAYRQLINPKAMPGSEAPEQRLPDYFMTAEEVSPKQHVDIQASAQRWIDSSISKTANIPTDFPYEDFKDIYLYAYEPVSYTHLDVYKRQGFLSPNCLPGQVDHERKQGVTSHHKHTILCHF